MLFQLVQKVARVVIEAFQGSNVHNEAAIQGTGNTFWLPFCRRSQFVKMVSWKISKSSELAIPYFIDRFN